MKNIFIVEDHPVMRNGLADYFAQTGRWEVAGTASSLTEAKKLLKEKTADVILLDIQLEDGWGLDIIPWLVIKNDNKSKTNIPLMAVYSSFDSYTHVSSALSLGVQAYITKRKTETELEAALISALQGNTYIDETAKKKLKNTTELILLLTKREAEILALVKNGYSNPQIAGKLGISRKTVENIISCVYAKTGIKSRIELERL